MHARRGFHKSRISCKCKFSSPNSHEVECLQKTMKITE
ncbi:unnamed protein product [Brassica oleracea var. botrytis]